MRNRAIHTFLVLIVAVFGLITACPQPTSTHQISVYTVSFDANGGNPAPEIQHLHQGDTVTEPAPMIQTGYGFGGWYKDPAFTKEWDFTADTVTGDTTLYALWDANYYTVGFEANGGNPAPGQQNIAYNSKVIKPVGTTNTGYGLAGWYTEADFENLWHFDSDAVTDNITLYAKWEIATTVTGASFAEKIRWLAANAESGGNYTVEVAADESTDPITLSYSGKNNITITIIGSETNRIISLTAIGAMFTVESDVTLILDDIELQGSSNPPGSMLDGLSAALVVVRSGASLILNNGAMITGNTYADDSSSSGGGVYVNGGTFIMNGGEIFGNTSFSPRASYGGGVCVNGGTFIMNGGEISGNTSFSTSSASYGGGVCVFRGIFTMNGGEISGNSTSVNSYGGGVYVFRGTFTMNDGEMSGNSSMYGGGMYMDGGTFTMSGGEVTSNSSQYGGGVYANGSTFSMSSGKISGNSSSDGSGVYVNGSTFSMSSGKISANTSSSDGGGVYMRDGILTMRDGEISGNSSLYGGGIYVYSGTFAMSGGEISGNSAAFGGGGVCVYYPGVFTKTGGTIFGYSDGNDKSNKANMIDAGCAVFIYKLDHGIFRINHKEATSGITDNLYYNGTVSPPAWSGDWAD